MKIEKFKTKKFTHLPDEVLKTLYDMTPSSSKTKFYRYIDSLLKFDGVVENFKEFLAYKANNTSMYDPVYVSLLQNIDVESAIVEVEKFKKNKATSLDGFISRFGEIEGRQKFKKFQRTSATAISRQIDGKSEEEVAAFHRNRSRRCIEFYLNRGLADTEDEAMEMVVEHQRKTSGLFPEFYVGKMDEDRIRELMKTIDSKKSLSLNSLKLKYPDDWMRIHSARVDRYRKTIGAVRKEDLSIYLDYKREIDKLTYSTIRLHGHHIQNIEMRSKDWHVDHRVSKYHGFLNKIPAEIIAHPMNLVVIPARENCSKGGKCSITLDELLAEIKRFEDEN